MWNEVKQFKQGRAKKSRRAHSRREILAKSLANKMNRPNDSVAKARLFVVLYGCNLVNHGRKLVVHCRFVIESGAICLAGRCETIRHAARACSGIVGELYRANLTASIAGGEGRAIAV